MKVRFEFDEQSFQLIVNSTNCGFGIKGCSMNQNFDKSLIRPIMIQRIFTAPKKFLNGWYL